MIAVRTALVLMTLACSSSMDAAEQQVVTITGFIYAAIPCVINNNKPITASFEDVQTARIDGSYKTIPLSYSLDCKRSASKDLRMQIRGNDAGFNTTLLRVPGYDNLGVAFKKDGVGFPVNTWADFDTNKQPTLHAVLEKNENSEIKAGAFSASATLVVDYR